MKNPYLFSYLPFFTIMLFSLTFGVYTVSWSLGIFREIGLYNGLLEFLTDTQMKLFLLTIYALAYFMVFSALKLIAETIHETAMLFFYRNRPADDEKGIPLPDGRGGKLIYFIGALASVAAVQSIVWLSAVFLAAAFIYFIYSTYQLHHQFSMMTIIGVIFFEVVIWAVLLFAVVYILLRLYNGISASIPGMEKDQLPMGS
ncbi:MULTISPECIES: DUF5366 family protein [Sporosarcina]|uniref:DUF5366 family protein n=1 Tax=Sporosarcina TaxID=1569 RepID=UPI00069457DE|nr:MULTISPECIES: DUF5366 family protein [Sporosarcina]WJY27799.1 DUF5366 family protein [Sporosarcina sp. 0.2-SM1T-5]